MTDTPKRANAQKLICGRRVNLYLDSETLERAAAIGGSRGGKPNLSEGIRRGLAAVDPSRLLGHAERPIAPDMNLEELIQEASLCGWPINNGQAIRLRDELMQGYAGQDLADIPLRAFVGLLINL
jgi:hypothetical protein